MGFEVFEDDISILALTTELDVELIGLLVLFPNELALSHTRILYTGDLSRHCPIDKMPIDSSRME